MKVSWVQAGIILGNDPTEKVCCPDCSNELLSVKDIFVAGIKKFERVMYCKECGAKNIL